VSTLRTAAWLAVAAATQLGCGKTNDPATNPRSNAGPAGAAGVGSAPTNPTAAGGVGGVGGVADMPLACDTPHPGPAPLGRLRNAELNRSLRSFMPAGSGAAQLQWLTETETAPPLDEPASRLSDGELGSVNSLAHEIAKLLADDASSSGWLAGCDVALKGEAPCRDLLAEPLVERAYRRALDDDDRAELADIFAIGRQLGGDFKSGMRAIVEFALQTPDFLYLLEQGNGKVSGDAVELTSYEMAARLAYFLTGSPPDDELFQAARDGTLEPDEVTAQAQRLLGSPQNRAIVSGFYSRLFSLDVVNPNVDPTFAPLLNQQVIEAMREGSLRFIEDVTFDGPGTFEALLSEPSEWVNGPLATFYGLPGVNGNDWQKVELDPTRAAGLFTQPAFLVAASYSSRTHPVQRGRAILSSVLCSAPGLPPPGVIAAVDVPPAVSGTTRQLLEAETGAAPCQNCHRDMNAIGFAFEHYDAVGRWRDVDSGLPVDSSGELAITDARGPFRDAVELVHHIATSDDAKACFVTQWLGDAYRRAEMPEDACSKAELAQAFIASGGNITQLVVALSQTDNFRYRLKAELAP